VSFVLHRITQDKYLMILAVEDTIAKPVARLQSLIFTSLSYLGCPNPYWRNTGMYGH